MSFQSALDIVRAGKGSMPAYPASTLSDEALRSDLQAVRLLPATGETAAASAAEFSWSAARIEQALSAGLQVFRKEDAEGMACANCHAPDGLDLALIAYDDASIIRRAQLHLSAEDALVLRDYVHAKRAELGLRTPCSTDWRPLQPAGAVLPGDSAEQRDEAFLNELKRRNLIYAVGRVTDESIAQAAWAELMHLDLRRLPIPVALPRWSEDGFDGEEHRTINDWIPGAARAPVDATWYQNVDAYLANPTDENLGMLLESYVGSTEERGYTKAAFDSEYDGYQIRETMLFKAQSVLLTSHLFRRELRQEAGWFQLRPEMPYAQISASTSFFRLQGGRHQENFCYNEMECPEYNRSLLNSLAKVEIDEGQFLDDTKVLTDPWWTLGFLFDRSLMQNGNQTLHYWQGAEPENNFPHALYFKPFVFTVRYLAQIDYRDQMRANEVPLTTSVASMAEGYPTYAGALDGHHVLGARGDANGMELRDGQFNLHSPDRLRLVMNSMAMVLFKQRAALRSELELYDRSELEYQVNTWRDDLLVVAAAQTDPEIHDHAAQLVALADDVLGLLPGLKDLKPTP